jgi:hypothetical protein
MWGIGEDGARIMVPTHWELQSAAFDLCAARATWWIPSWEADWFAAERKAVEYVKGQLFWRLARFRHVSDLLARKLVRLSVCAHEIWWDEGGSCRPADSHHLRPGDLVAAIGVELTGSRGRKLLEDVARWDTGTATEARLAYRIWEDQSQIHGQDRRHWELSGWLLKLVRAANRNAGIGNRRHDDILKALGTLIWTDPLWTARAFDPDFTPGCAV